MGNDHTIKHVAIIMDGNGRWAQQHGHERTFGHEQGVEAVRSVTEGATEMGIPYLTLYTFSTENWNRPKEEVDMLMRLLTRVIAKEVDTFMKNGVRLLTTGRLDTLPEDCQKSMRDAEEITANNKNTTLILALSYSGRSELVDTAKQIARKAANGQLNPDDIDENTIQQHLYHPEIPDVDLLIRTGGDLRISNFLLWEIAYAELFFSPIMWPDFRKDHLREILEQFTHRERRFGKTGEQVRAH
ncbi:MAG: di-trans,poly-cis-decaprenylcistransferase [Bacteroidales bacterium]|jgi:undecaprenyl diphosphate synthase|nr:di-trans,poly-cis-decaprenylcistransferase [Bacteroidales bacterium]